MDQDSNGNEEFTRMEILGNEVVPMKFNEFEGLNDPMDIDEEEMSDDPMDIDEEFLTRPRYFAENSSVRNDAFFPFFWYT